MVRRCHLVEFLMRDLGTSSMLWFALFFLLQPEMDGYELMGHLREIGWQGREPPTVMACSADWTLETEEKCLAVGFDGVLRKPITLPDLQRFLADLAMVEDDDDLDG